MNVGADILGRLSVPAAMAPLLTATGSDGPLALRAAAATGLGDLGAAEAAPKLEALLSDSVYQVAHDAAGALQRLGQAGDEALLRTMGTGAERAAVHATQVLAMAAIEAEPRPRPPARRQRAGLRGTDARL